jgi:ethanolamine transporter EutH
MGTSRLRKTIYLCSWSAKKSNPQCIEMYKRLKEKSKPNKVINVALANKLLRQAFAMGKYQREYEKNYQKIFVN